MTDKLTPNPLATKPGDVWFDELRKGAIRATKILALENINAKAFVPVLLAEIDRLRGMLEVARMALGRISTDYDYPEPFDIAREALKKLEKIG